MKIIRTVITGFLLLTVFGEVAEAAKPNIILIFADDISPRELPVYNSPSWSKPGYGTTTDPALRAKTPVLDKLAQEGCWITTAWSATICSPSRAMMMTGRFAHLHKWWHNGDYGKTNNSNNHSVRWPVYSSSPVQLGRIAQQAGYGTFWTGKTQMTHDNFSRYGFDEAVITPHPTSMGRNPNTDFDLYAKKVDGKRLIINRDTGLPRKKGYAVASNFWKPSVLLMNHPETKGGAVFWPNKPEDKAQFGLHTYGPDIELNFALNFMERTHKAGKPFFVYHTSHLGHGQYDWLHPNDNVKWPGTPVIKWDGKAYTRTEPKVTGDNGVYDTHGTVTSRGIHHHINYLDYQMWLYRKKLEEMGVADNTVIIFCADNGTHGYGKGSPDRQKGCHVPMIIYAPGMTKKGKQDVLVSIADMLPTVAELAGEKIPSDYEINGQSLVPFLFTEKAEHRKWLYSYKKNQQFVRGKNVMKDGTGAWYDVSTSSDDLMSFRKITDWERESQELKQERKELLNVIKPFDLYKTAHDAPDYKAKSRSKVAKGK